MTKEEKDKINDMEKRIRILEQYLLKQMTEPAPAPYQPSPSTQTCVFCGQTYSGWHNCPPQGVQATGPMYYTSSASTASAVAGSSVIMERVRCIKCHMEYSRQAGSTLVCQCGSIIS